jgi:hypothetical protein
MATLFVLNKPMSMSMSMSMLWPLSLLRIWSVYRYEYRWSKGMIRDVEAKYRNTKPFAQMVECTHCFIWDGNSDISYIGGEKVILTRPCMEKSFIVYSWKSTTEVRWLSMSCLLMKISNWGTVVVHVLFIFGSCRMFMFGSCQVSFGRYIKRIESFSNLCLTTQVLKL